MSKLTERMKNWLEGTGAHIGTATKHGVPTVIVVERAKVDHESVRFPLTPTQRGQVAANIAENPQVAFGPGGLGCIRAAYQFKGKARIEREDLIVAVDEIYCTKPGPEAGLRLDTLPFDAVLKFERTRWRDEAPPR